MSVVVEIKTCMEMVFVSVPLCTLKHQLKQTQLKLSLTFVSVVVGIKTCIIMEMVLVSVPALLGALLPQTDTQIDVVA